MMVFAQEKLSKIRHEAMPLLLRHWNEIALNKATTPLDPDWTTYRAIEDAGVFHVTTARLDGQLIGYVSFLIYPNLHYRTVVTAQDDIFFLAWEHRRGRTGILLLEASHRAMKALGATRIVHHHKDHLDLGPLFRRLGFDLVEHVYSREA